MEVVESCSALLSNREVLELLRSNITKKPTNLATILYETTSYLESSPAASTSIASLTEFLDQVKEHKFDLTKVEKIQLANLKPQNETELHLIVDNIEERFTEQQRVDLLQLVQSINQQSGDPGEHLRKKLKQ